ncbi:MAG: hypothetical protein ACLPJH_17940 [Myxococcaceae bacterium]
MFLGHVGVGLALKRAVPTLSAGALVAAALLLDWLLGLFVLAGIEQVHVPEDFAHRRYFTFTFPWSHGLLATLLWSALAAAVTWALVRGPARGWGALAMGVAVASHFPCDVVEHLPELPLLGPDSARLGLGLWRWMPWALALELTLAAVGLLLYGRATPGGFPRGMALLVLAVAAVALPGQLLATQAPPAQALAVTWLVQAPLLGLVAGWLDARRRAPPRPHPAAPVTSR